jgi:heme/copper-type cytochrome/quinol oxidase subunit 2
VARQSSAKAPTAVRICSVPLSRSATRERDFFMLTPDEEKFVEYWQEQRQHKKAFLRKFSIALPALSILAMVFFINFLSGWYRKADKELRRHSSVMIVILVAVIAIVVFVVIFTARQKWERNEEAYEALLKKRDKI